jgi:hypothetical protein
MRANVRADALPWLILIVSAKMMKRSIVPRLLAAMLLVPSVIQTVLTVDEVVMMLAIGALGLPASWFYLMSLLAMWVAGVSVNFIYRDLMVTKRRERKVMWLWFATSVIQLGSWAYWPLWQKDYPWQIWWPIAASVGAIGALLELLPAGRAEPDASHATNSPLTSGLDP